MDKKLTDAEIIKGLEDTLHRIKGAEHLIVPKLGVENLCNGLENALDLINRLQADCENYKQIAEHQQSVTLDRGFEIKRLKEKIESLQAEERLKKTKYIFSTVDYCADDLDKALKEIERLKLECGLAKFEKYKAEFEEFRAEIKAEAVKEFAERLKESWQDNDYYWEEADVYKWIDNLLKELVGEDKCK